MNGNASLCTIVGSFAFLSIAFASTAQDDPYDGGYVRDVGGDVTLQPAQNPEPESADINMPVLAGDRLWTGTGAFAEIRFADGGLMRIGEDTKVDFMKFGAEPNVRVWSGSIVVNTEATGSRVRVDTPGGSVYQASAGTYRVDVTGGIATTVSALDGTVELATGDGSVLIDPGMQSVLDIDGAPSIPSPIDTAAADTLDTWAQQQVYEEPVRRSVPLAEVPTEVHHYVDDLSEHGTWREHDDHGSVWYPTGVAGNWAPYRNGRWTYTSYGYTWVSHEPWGWAPYHYGRWGYNNYGWYWIPGRRFGPAWVSFALGPSWVGWSPLGYHGGSVFSYQHGFYGHGRYPKHRNRGYRYGHAVPPHVYDHGAGWNFSNRQHFGRRGRARLRASDVRHSASRARMHHQGAVLDRGLKARPVGHRRSFAPRGRQVFSNERASVGRSRGASRGSSGRAVRRGERTTRIVDRGAERSLSALNPDARQRANRSRASRTRRGRTDSSRTEARRTPGFRSGATAGSSGRAVERSRTRQRRVEPAEPAPRMRQGNRSRNATRSRTRAVDRRRDRGTTTIDRGRSRNPDRNRERNVNRARQRSERNQPRSSDIDRSSPRNQRGDIDRSSRRNQRRDANRANRRSDRSRGQRDNVDRARGRNRQQNANRANRRSERNRARATRSTPRSQRSVNRNSRSSNRNQGNVRPQSRSQRGSDRARGSRSSGSSRGGGRARGSRGRN